MAFQVGDRVQLRGGSWTRPENSHLNEQIVTIVQVYNSLDEAKFVLGGESWYVWDTENRQFGDGKAYDDWPGYRVSVEQPNELRYLVAVEGYGNEPYFVEFSNELVTKHPDIAFKFGELIGLRLKYIEEDEKK